MIQCGVAALEKGPAIFYMLRLALGHLASSESIHISLLGH